MSKQTKKISSKSDKKILAFGIAMLIASIAKIIITILVEKKVWPNGELDVLFFLIGILGVLLMILEIINLNSIKKINRDLQYPEYGFDYQGELTYYCNVGKREKNVAKFRNYSEWKKHLEDDFGYINNNENAYRFMRKKLRGKECVKELIIGLIIPLEIFAITVLYGSLKETTMMEMLVSLVIIVLMITILVTVEYGRCKDEINFIDDFIEVVFPKNKRNQI